MLALHPAERATTNRHATQRIRFTGNLHLFKNTSPSIEVCAISGNVPAGCVSTGPRPRGSCSTSPASSADCEGGSGTHRAGGTPRDRLRTLPPSRTGAGTRSGPSGSRGDRPRSRPGSAVEALTAQAPRHGQVTRSGGSLAEPSQTTFGPVDGLTSGPMSSTTTTGSSQDGQAPPTPTRRMTVEQSVQRRSQSARAPQPSHASTVMGTRAARAGTTTSGRATARRAR